MECVETSILLHSWWNSERIFEKGTISGEELCLKLLSLETGCYRGGCMTYHLLAPASDFIIAIAARWGVFWKQNLIIFSQRQKRGK